MEGSVFSEFAPLFTEVKRRLRNRDNDERWAQTCREFVRALCVKDLSKDGGLPPALDAIWHECILNTRDYTLLCMRLRGCYIHHTTVSEQDGHVERISRNDQTVLNYRKRFREEPDPTLWDEDRVEVEAPVEDAPALKLRLNYRPYVIIVKTFDGLSIPIYDLRGSDTVETVKQRVRGAIHVPVDQQRLIFAGRQLEDGRTLADYNIQTQSVLHMIKRLRGC